MLSECLSNHKPYIKMPKRQTKKAGCVLTSYESRQILGREEKSMPTEGRETCNRMRRRQRGKKREMLDKKGKRMPFK